MSEDLERREFLRRAGFGAAALGAMALAGCGQEAEEEGAAGSTGSPAPRTVWWLAPTIAPGEHKLMDLPYDYDALELPEQEGSKARGISKQVVTWHHDKHHAGYVKALNTIELDIAAMKTIEVNANYSPYAELKRRETFNACGMYLHDIYWSNMCKGGQNVDSTLPVLQKIVHDFGSTERWREEFVATAQTPNAGWAVLAWTPYDKRLHNFACQLHDLGGVWGSVPLICLDVWEHAYYYDYGPDRASYIESFMQLLNWPAVDRSFQLVKRG
jgi:Fe-Mn family superoxide dismutase